MNRHYRNKIILILLGYIFAAGFYAYGEYGPYYRVVPISSPISFSSSNPQSIKFDVDRSEEYLIEIYLHRVFSTEKMQVILGDIQSGGGGKIDILWRLEENNKLVKEGSSKEYGYKPFFGSDTQGLIIGSFWAEAHKKYLLKLTVQSVDKEWDKTKPYVRVVMESANLEDSLPYYFFGVVLFLVSSVYLIIFILNWILKKR
jgi:hypothetical protein